MVVRIFEMIDRMIKVNSVMRKAQVAIYLEFDLEGPRNASDYRALTFGEGMKAVNVKTEPEVWYCGFMSKYCTLRMEFIDLLQAYPALHLHLRDCSSQWPCRCSLQNDTRFDAHQEKNLSTFLAYFDPPRSQERHHKIA